MNIVSIVYKKLYNYRLNRQNTIYKTGCISTIEINKLSTFTLGIFNPIITKAPIKANRHIIWRRALATA